MEFSNVIILIAAPIYLQTPKSHHNGQTVNGFSPFLSIRKSALSLRNEATAFSTQEFLSCHPSKSSSVCSEAELCLNCTKTHHCQRCYIFFWQPQHPIKISGSLPIITPFRNTEHLPALNNVLIPLKEEILSQTPNVCFSSFHCKKCMQIENTTNSQAFCL